MSAEPTAQLFIGRLSSAATASELERTFCKFGELVRCEVKRGTNMCYAFVEYSSPDHAAEALRKCNGMPVCGEDIVVQFARAAARKRDNNNCFRCGREGHWARDCSSGPHRDGPSPRRSRSPPRSHGHRDSRSNHRDDHRNGHRRDDHDHHRGDRRSHASNHHRSESRSGEHRGSHRRRSPDRSHRRHSRSRSRSPRGLHRRPAARSPARRDTGSGQHGDRRRGWDTKSVDSAIGNSTRAPFVSADSGW